jgi:hypothetical protein
MAFSRLSMVPSFSTRIRSRPGFSVPIVAITSVPPLPTKHFYAQGFRRSPRRCVAIYCEFLTPWCSFERRIIDHLALRDQGPSGFVR